jgi:hypothetical protein
MENTMAKDWKAEYDRLLGEKKQLEEELRYLRQEREDRFRREEQARDKFKELLIDVLGR